MCCRMQRCKNYLDSLPFDGRRTRIEVFRNISYFLQDWKALAVIPFRSVCGPEKGRFCVADTAVSLLTAEAVQSSSLSLQRVDDVHGRDGFALGVLRVSDGIANDVLEEDFQDASRFFVDQSGDSLHSASTCQTADCRLRDALDVITKDLTMTLSASLAQSLTALASARHVADRR